ncbi:MAG: hypothetical protein ABI593_01230 [Betaproteobacteria bacterium]
MSITWTVRAPHSPVLGTGAASVQVVDDRLDQGLVHVLRIAGGHFLDDVAADDRDRRRCRRGARMIASASACRRA